MITLTKPSGNTFVLIMLFCVSFFTPNKIVAQGPNASEAASFEPVDATDMVNLVTGDLTYVLPLINVPSPEGGYPLALSYHAGVAMDQEASWVGLGWSLNPGAINRSVNGYPDDWKNGFTENILYDAGGEVVDFSSTLALRTSVSSLALSLSYNNNRGFGGSVGLNVGFLMYDYRKGLGINVKIPIIQNIGIGISKWVEDNETAINLGYFNKDMNSIGISISSNSLGVYSSGVGVSVPLAGKNNTDLTVKTSFVGTVSIGQPFWGINLSFRKLKYSLYDNRDYSVNGVGYPFSPSDLISSDESHDQYLKFGKIFDSYDNMPAYDSYFASSQGISGSFSPKYIIGTAIIEESDYGTKASSFGNMEFVKREMKDAIIDPNDLGRVSFDNGKMHFYFDLVNSSYLSSNDAIQNFNLNLPIAQPITSIADLRSSISSTITINGKSFNNYNPSINRKKDGNFIEKFTVSEILNGSASVKGFLDSKDPNSSSSYSSSVFQNIEQNAIGGFKITVADGKTYHYSLPVYQNEEFVRQYYNKLDNNGNIIEQNENSKFLENRKFTPYATHWLLTAITGPDYIKADINRQYPDEGDFGYWVRFDFGKWSDGFGWQSNFSDKEYLTESRYSYGNGPRGGTGGSSEDPRDPNQIPNHEINVKAYGVKQIYYLNQIKTRTHTALFVKKDRLDNKGKEILIGSSIQNPLIHSDVKKTLNINDLNVSISDAKFRTYINIPQQKSLALDKIILIKNEYNNCKPNIHSNQGLNGKIWIQESYDQYTIQGYYGNITKTVHDRSWETEFYGNILDIKDIDNSIISKASKIIEFDYNPVSEIFKNSITLNKVTFGGKKGVSVTPPYKFSYNTRIFNKSEIEKHWGFNKVEPAAWSLKEIQTPVGGKIKIQYESDSYFPVLAKACETRRCLESTNPRELFIGGGVRVKEISLFNGGLLTNKDVFNYNIFNTNSTSGVSIYTPKEIPINGHFLPIPQVLYGNVEVVSQGSQPSSEKLKTQYVFNVFNLDLIPHTVYAKEIEGFFSIEGSYMKSYQDLGTLVRDGLRNSTVNRNYKVKLKNRDIKDNFSSLGQLQSVTILNSNNHMIHRAENIYVSPENILQGKTRENYYYFNKNSTFNYLIENDPILGIVPNWNSSILSTEFNYELGNTYITKYPSRLKEVKSFSDNHVLSSRFERYDFDTGQVLETVTKDSKGIEFKNETVPAYTIPVYSSSSGFGMGSKVDDYRNKNMLSQKAMTKTYLKQGGIWKETGVGITTWNNHWNYFDASGAISPETLPERKIWRKHKNFIWDGALNLDGTYSGFTGADDSFNWAVQTSSTETAQPNPKWKNVSTTTQYDHYSMPLEARDINGNYASTKMGDGNSKVLAVGNAKYTEMFYTGAEYLSSNTAYFDGHIKSYGRNTVNAHTGKYSISVAAGGKGFEVNMLAGQHRAGKYKVSVWVLKANHSSARINIKGALKAFNGEEVFAGNWVLKTHYEDLSSGAETIFVTSSGSPVYFDDFRLRPVSSSMASYVYNEWDELWYVIGNNDLSSKFEYDNGGRLVRTYSEVEDYNGSGTGGFKKIGETGYTYKGTTEGGFIGPPPTEEVYISSGSFVSNNFSNPTQVLNTSICNTGTILTKAVGLNTSVPKVGTQIMINGVNATQSMVSSAWGVNYSGGIRWVRFYSGNVTIVWDVNPITGIVTAMSSVYSCN